MLVADVVSQSSEQGLREVAGIGTVLFTTGEAVDAVTVTRPDPCR
ncbi:hypothetical protein [Actinoplanes xinjiangensis]